MIVIVFRLHRITAYDAYTYLTLHPHGALDRHPWDYSTLARTRRAVRREYPDPTTYRVVTIHG